MLIPGRKVVTGAAIILVVTGVAILWWRPVQSAYVRHAGRQQNQHRLQQVQHAAQPVPFELGQPQAIRLARLGINLKVKPGHYDSKNQSWTLDRQHAFNMVKPGGQQTATPIIYGHDIPGVFLALDGVVAHEILEVTRSDGSVYSFAFADDVKVPPHDTTVLDQEYPRSILLITCTGRHFEERRILRFTFIGQTQPSQGAQR